MPQLPPLPAACAALLALAAVSLFTGAIPLAPGDLLTDPGAWDLLTQSRIPRTLAAMLAGMALASAGQIMQILARNRFVEPMSAGAGQSAALGILAATLFWPGAAIWAKMAIAALFALAGAAGLMALLRRLPPHDPLLPPLVALIWGGLIGGVVTFIAYQGDMMQFLSAWTTGELSGAVEGRYEMLWLSALAAFGAWLMADRLTALALGEDNVRAIGMRPGPARATGLAAAALGSAAVVVTVGAIPFVGLVAPNLVARFMGDDLRRALPVSALFGAILVLAADILGRVIRMPFEIPVAAVAGVLGALIFLVMLLRGPRHAL